jgi:hypothetical protein
MVRTTGRMNERGQIIRGWDRIRLPSSSIKRWPAVMLAVSRTHRVRGRIVLLISSINTMKFISAVGVPCGSRCASMCFVFLVHPKSIREAQRIKARGEDITTCAVVENTWGYSAMKFRMKINIKILIKTLRIPF